MFSNVWWDRLQTLARCYGGWAATDLAPEEVSPRSRALRYCADEIRSTTTNDSFSYG